MTIRNNIENLLYALGKYGCYVLCLISIAEEVIERHIDIVTAVQIGIEKKCFRYNDNDKNDNDNFFVEDPCKFLNALTGFIWDVRKALPDETIKPGEYVVKKYVNGSQPHFERDNFKPIKNSITVSQGKLESLRLFRIKK